MKSLLRILALTIAFFSLVWECSGQSCTNATCPAASASEADVLAAMPAPSNTHSAVTVVIPAGSASWSGAFGFSMSSAPNVTDLTVQGATTVNCTGTAGQSSWSCPASDQTIITDGYSSQPATITITTAGSTTKFRWTGTTLKTSAGTAKNNGMLYIVGGSHNVRIDHNHIDENGQTNSMIQVGGDTQGVADHNLFSLGTNSQVGNGFRDFASSDGVGDAAWSSPTGWGQISGWWFLESDYFTGGSPTDCYNGGKLVVRYSTINNAFVMALHGTKNDAGRGRSCRATDINNNYMSGSPNANAVIGQNGGTSMLWGNNIASGYNHFNAPGAPRNFVGGDSGLGSGNAWLGMAGTTVRSALGQSGTDPWDANSSSATGYPVLDGMGRGQGSAINTSSPAWPSQFLEPEYQFMNTIAAASNGYLNDVSSQNNRDIYVDCNGREFNHVAGCSFFNGTQGTGFGNFSARPSTCTPGPGGPYGASPTGSYGTAYYAVDQSTLYVCDSTNHWTVVYQPPVYPHPLVSGGGTTFYTFTLTNNNSTVSGTNNVSGSYAAGTTIGPLTVTPNPGYAFVNWSGTAPTCNGTSTTIASFTLSSSMTCTANVVATSPTAPAPTMTPGGGIFSGSVVVTISDALNTANVIVSAQEGSNGNASNGDAPSRNLHSNCREGYNGTAYLPNDGTPLGEEYCTTSDKTSAVANGGSSSIGVVTSSVIGTGTHALNSGHDAGGTNSPASISSSYGGASAGHCSAVGTNIPTGIAGLTLAGAVSNTAMVYTITTKSSNFNTSLLAPTKFVASNGDLADHYVIEDCIWIPSTVSASGEHLETDFNHNLSTGHYFGIGFHLNMNDSSIYSCPQGCSGWTKLKGVNVADGTVKTTFAIPQNTAYYRQFWFHRDASKFYYDKYCLRNITGGGTLQCWALQVASTGATPTGNWVDKSSWTRNEFTSQVQWDINAASTTLTLNADFRNWIAYNLSGTAVICYTTDSSIPTGNNAGACVHGTPYTGPLTFTANTVLKAIATQSGYNDSPVTTETYTLSTPPPPHPPAGFSGHVAVAGVSLTH